jgi:hypothetical protein
MPSHFAAAMSGTNRKDTRQVIRISDEITCQSRDAELSLKVPWRWLVSIDLLKKILVSFIASTCGQIFPFHAISRGSPTLTDNSFMLR